MTRKPYKHHIFVNIRNNFTKIRLHMYLGIETLLTYLLTYLLTTYILVRFSGQKVKGQAISTGDDPEARVDAISS